MIGKFNKNGSLIKLQELFKVKKAPSSVVVLDIDDRWVTLLCASKGIGSGAKAVKFTRYEEFELELPENPKEKDIGAALSRKLKELRISNGNVVLGIPRSEVMLRQMLIPCVENEGEVASMIHFQITRDLPFRPEDAVIDFSINGTIETHLPPENTAEKEKGKGSVQKQLEVTVAVVPQILVSHYQEIAKAAGFKLIALGFESASRAVALSDMVPPSVSSGSMMLLSAAKSTVTIDISKGGRLVASREATLGPRNTEDQFKEWQEQLVMETMRCIHSYEQDDFHGLINRIYVTRFGSETQRLVDALCEKVDSSDILVEEFAPAKTILLKDAVIKNESNIVLTSGFASELLNNGKLSLDFLNPKQPSISDSGKTKQMVLGIVTLLLVFLMFFVIRSHVIQVRMAEKDAVQQQITKLSKNQPIWRQNILQAVSLRTWQKSENYWLDHLAVLSSLLPSAQELYVTSFSTGSRSNIVLSVRATRSDVITKLDAQLREAGYRLKSPAIIPVGGKGGYAFQTTFELLLPNTKESPDLESLNAPPARPEDDISTMPVQERREMMKKAEEQANPKPQQMAKKDEGQVNPKQQQQQRRGNGGQQRRKGGQ